MRKPTFNLLTTSSTKMLQSRVIGRSISRAAVQLSRPAISAVGVRFNQVSSQSSAIKDESSSLNASVDVTGNRSNKTENDSGKRSDTQKKNGRKHIANRKLRDISAQVKSSVDSANVGEISEAIDILEEGISYLREIQEVERLPSELLYSVFQPITATLFDKITADGANLGSRSVSDVLTMLVEQGLAHNYHFMRTVEHVLKNSAGDESYSKVLQIWLQYLQYSKEVGVGRMNYMIQQPYLVYKERNFDSRDLKNLAFFAYVMHCLNANVEYNVKDAMKILQIQDSSRVPERFHVVSTIKRLGLQEPLKSDLSTFERKINELNTKSMDPNGALVTRRIEQAIQQNNPIMLNNLYQQMKTSSVANDIQISEATLNRIMNAYIELHLFGDVIDIFRSFLQSSAKPSVATWDLVLKALGHPSNVNGMDAAEKKKMTENIEATVNSMIASGIAMNARTLAIVVGCFANLGRFDLVDKYLKQYESVPIVHLTRNNILVGLVLNKDVAKAEQKLKDFAKEDPTYQPSTGVMNAFLSHYVSVGNNEAVEGIINYMRQNGIEEDVGTTTTFINYYFKMYRNKGKVPDVAGLLKELSNASMPINQFTVTSIVDGLAKDGVNLEAARSVFNYFSKENSRFKYNTGLLTSMIKAELDFGSLHNAEELFAIYITNLKNDTRAWNMMIAALLAKKEKIALEYHEKLLQQRPFNVKPNYFTYYYMLDHFVKTGNEKRIQWTLDEIAKADLQDMGNVLPRRIHLLRHKFNVSPALKEKISKRHNNL